MVALAGTPSYSPFFTTVAFGQCCCRLLYNGMPSLINHTLCCDRDTAPRAVPLGARAWTAGETRRAFLEFFSSPRGGQHTFVPSCSVVPRRDDGTYFVNSGVVQFKSRLLGHAPTDSYLSGLSRVTNSQRCIRIGGKHNDLAQVGQDGSHLTFFEMLGSWSFGDLFQGRSLVAWHGHCSQRCIHLSPRQLYVTYFGGCDHLGLPADIETRDIWLQVGSTF